MSLNPISKTSDTPLSSISDIAKTKISPDLTLEQLPNSDSIEIPKEIFKKIQAIYANSSSSFITNSRTTLLSNIQTQILLTIQLFIDPHSRSNTPLYITFIHLFEEFNQGNSSENLIKFLSQLLEKINVKRSEGSITSEKCISCLLDVATSISLIKLNSLEALKKSGTYYALTPMKDHENQAKFCAAVQNYRHLFYQLQTLLIFKDEFNKIDDTTDKIFLNQFYEDLENFPCAPNVPRDEIIEFSLFLIKFQSACAQSSPSDQLELAQILKNFPLNNDMLTISLSGLIPYDPSFVMKNLKAFSGFIPTTNKFIDNNNFKRLENVFSALKNIFPFIKFADWERINKRLENCSAGEHNEILLDEINTFGKDKSVILTKNTLNFLKENPFFKTMRQRYGTNAEFIREINYLLDKVLIPNKKIISLTMNDVFIPPALYRHPTVLNNISPPTAHLASDAILKKIKPIIESSLRDRLTSPHVPIYFTILSYLITAFKDMHNEKLIMILHRSNVSYNKFLLLFMESCEDFKNGNATKLITLIADLKPYYLDPELGSRADLAASLKHCDTMIELLKFNNYEILQNTPAFLLNMKFPNSTYFAYETSLFSVFSMFGFLEPTISANLNACEYTEEVIPSFIDEIFAITNIKLDSNHISRFKGILTEYQKVLDIEVNPKKLKADFDNIKLLVAKLLPALTKVHSKNAVDHKFLEQNKSLIQDLINKIIYFSSSISQATSAAKKQQEFYNNLFVLLKSNKFDIIATAFEQNHSDAELQEIILEQVNAINSDIDQHKDVPEVLKDLSENTLFTQILILNSLYTTLDLLDQLLSVVFIPYTNLIKKTANEYDPVLSPSILFDQFASATFIGKKAKKATTSIPFENAGPSKSKSSIIPVAKISISEVQIADVDSFVSEEFETQFKLLEKLQHVKETFEKNILAMKGNCTHVGVSGALTNAYTHFNDLLCVLYRLNHPSNHPLSPKFTQTVVIDLIRHGSLASEQILLALNLESNKVKDPTIFKTIASHNLYTLFQKCRWKKEPTAELRKWVMENNFGEIYARNLNQSVLGISSIKSLLIQARSLTEENYTETIPELLSAALNYTNHIGALFSSVKSELSPIEKSKGKSDVKSKGKLKGKSVAKPETKGSEIVPDFYPSFKSLISKLSDTEVFDKFLSAPSPLSSLDLEDVKDVVLPALEALKPSLEIFQALLESKKIPNSIDNITTNLLNHLAVEYNFNKTINPITAHTHLSNILLLNQMIIEETLINLLKFRDINVNIDDHNIPEMLLKLKLSSADFTEEENNFLTDGRITRKLVRYPARVSVKNRSAYLENIKANLSDAKQLFAKQKFTFEHSTDDGFQMQKKYGIPELQNIRDVATKDIEILSSVLQKIFEKVNEETFIDINIP